MAASAHAHVKLKVGDEPPDKLGTAASGERVRLSHYRGKIVVISFWASWCGPCRKELPILAGMQKQATRERIVVFLVDWRESYAQFHAIAMALKKSDLTIISDKLGFLGDQYDVTAIPHMLVVGQDGKIAAIHIGYSERALPSLAAEINALWAKVHPNTQSKPR